MKNSYIRFGRRYSVPSTAQILDELKTDFIPGYVPISRGSRRTFSATHDENTNTARRPPGARSAIRKVSKP